MPIDIAERYRLIFDELHHTSDFRIKIMQIWGLIYAALATLFVWVHSAAPLFSAWIPALAAFMTILMWIADFRNCMGIRTSMRVGANIETGASVPDGQRFFTSIDRRSISGKILSHFAVITMFSVGMFVSFCWLSWYLFQNEGALPGGSRTKEYKVVKFEVSTDNLEDFLNERIGRGWILKTIFHEPDVKVADLIFEKDK